MFWWEGEHLAPLGKKNFSWEGWLGVWKGKRGGRAVRGYKYQIFFPTGFNGFPHLYPSLSCSEPLGGGVSSCLFFLRFGGCDRKNVVLDWEVGIFGKMERGEGHRNLPISLFPPSHFSPFGISLTSTVHPILNEIYFREKREGVM